jgi:hypothetical protein
MNKIIVAMLTGMASVAALAQVTAPQVQVTAPQVTVPSAQVSAPQMATRQETVMTPARHESNSGMSMKHKHRHHRHHKKMAK